MEAAMRRYGAMVLGLMAFLVISPESAMADSCPGPREDFGAIKKWVDPNNQMGESVRNLAAVGAVYQFKMEAVLGRGRAR
jgi:hypothetical protein